MKTATRKTPRYVVMSIPGRLNNGADTWWFVFDTRRHKSVPDAMLPGNQGHIKVARLARAMNVYGFRR